MAKKTVRLATNIGTEDARKFGLANDYDLKDLTEGKTVSIDEKFLADFVAHGWVASDAATVKAAQAADTAPDEDEESPVADTPLPKAVEMIGNMRSKDKLQHIIDTDARAGAKDAARKRLQALG